MIQNADTVPKKITVTISVQNAKRTYMASSERSIIVNYDEWNARDNPKDGYEEFARGLGIVISQAVEEVALRVKKLELEGK